MHFHAFVIINIEESVRKKIPEIIKANNEEMKKMEVESKDMTFDKILDSYEKRKPNEYEKLLYALKQKVRKPPDRYCAYGNTEDKKRKFDSWTVVDMFMPEYLLDDPETFNDLFPEAIMNSDCSWVEMGWSKNEEENEKLSSKWEKLVRETLEENREKSVVLLVNCDS